LHLTKSSRVNVEASQFKSNRVKSDLPQVESF